MQHFTRATVAALTLGFASVAAANIVFNDPTVSPASYMTLIYSNDPTVNIAVSATASGNLGAALQVRFTNSGGPVNLVSLEGFLNPAFAYDPALQGAIQSVGFSNDRYVDFGATLNPFLTVFSRVLLLQGGKYYFAAFLDPQVRGAFYTSAAPSPFSAADFSLFDFNTGVADPLQHPDFSSAGSLIDFGFASRFNLGTAGVPFALDGVFRFDNISIAVNAVPEPSTLALVCLGLAVAGVCARRRKAMPRIERAPALA